MSEDVTKPDDAAPLVVGVGASAGGLDALRKLFNATPADVPMAFIVVQHMDPTQESMLAELLARQTKLKVSQLERDERIEPGHVYVIPPDTFLEVEGDMIRLHAPEQRRGMRMAIDYLFRSLAKARGNLAVGIVLSGSGSDGTAGLRSIRAEGGLALVQLPETADHQGMPQSAIDSGAADKVLAIEKMPEALAQYARHPYSRRGPAELSLEQETENGWQEIDSLLKSKNSFDLSQYRDATVRRRVARRMGFTGHRQLSDYLAMLRTDAEEREELVRDLLIGVTDFFRDREAWEALDREVIRRVVETSDSEIPLRIWVPGCASGEEAYTVAMLCAEAIAGSNRKIELQVFATDADEEAIRFARTGLYPAAIQSHVAPAMLKKYFVRTEEGNFQVISRLRDSISFAVQNVTSDPPFSRIDLICCRNLLIYLRRIVQERIMRLFHFSLRPGGFLFLGSSESLSGGRELFKPVVSRFKIFRRREVELEVRRRVTKTLPVGKFGQRGAVRNSPSPESPAQLAHRTLVESCLPPTALIDAGDEVIYLHGEASPFLTLPQGEPRMNLLHLVSDALRPRLRAALFKCRREDHTVTIDAETGEGGTAGRARIVLHPVGQGVPDERWVAVTFEARDREIAHQPCMDLPPGAESLVEQLERELQTTREDLQITVEELESSHEELQGSHEEALSMNEEFQSANEELEATSEELRALNEELMTVNAELKEKIEQVQQANEDLNNFFGSTNLATLFLDAEMRLNRLTPAAGELLALSPRDIGRSIERMSGNLLEDLSKNVSRVLQELSPVEEEIRTAAGQCYIRRMLPYRTEDQRIQGVVVTFNDVTRIRRTTDLLGSRERQQHAAAQLGLQALSVSSLDELFRLAVRTLAETLEVEYTKVLEYVPGEDHFILRAGVGWKKDVGEGAIVPGGRDSQAGYTLSSGQPVIVADLRKERRFSGPHLLRDAGVVSGMSCLISSRDGRAFGVLGAHTRSERVFTTDDTNFMVTMANIIAMAIDRHRGEKAQVESAYRLRLATEAGGMGVWQWQLESGKAEWSVREFELLGLEQSREPSVDAFLSMVHPEDREPLQAHIRHVIESGSDYEAEFRIRRADGEERWLAGRGGSLRDEEGKAVALVGVNYDITEQKRNQEELKNADRRKNEFLAVLSHELRNPLAAIMASFPLLNSQESDESTWARGVIQRQVSHLSRLIDDLLDITRITQGKIDIQKSRVRLAEVVAEATNAVRGSCERLGHQLEVSVVPEDGEIVADPSRLEQVLVNLLNNACKFMKEPGQIRVQARLEDGQATLAVSDTGIGIRPEDLNSIFELFSQVSDHLPEGSLGAGIGLSLARSITELHGGSLEAQSRGEGNGAKFIVRLPVDGSESSSAPEMSAHETRSARSLLGGIRSRRVLVVDDNRDSAEAIGRLLRRAGHEVRIEHDGVAGEAAVSEFRPDAILLDLGMPGQDGFETARAIRRNVPFGQVLLIAATGFGHQQYVDRAFEAGFDHHLVKPIDLKRLDSLLATDGSGAEFSGRRRPR